VVASLGVVFGDIGTSPIYTLQTAFNPGDPHPVEATVGHVFGMVSLIFWAVTLIVCVKYVGFVMSADDDGEGGIMALISQIKKVAGHVPARRKFILAGVGVLGAGLFFGDSMVTPAISVLSAVEGTETIEPSLDTFVVPITVTILVLLFMLQRLGSGGVGRLFGPVMIVWFATVAALGIRGISMHPAVLKALSPSYGFDFLFHSGMTGFYSLTAVVLAFTGVEALYADMGHFGRSAITRAWLFIVFPACILSYLGQSALILERPGAISAPFFRLMPHGGLIPLVILATAATVIASQAVISGTFSIAHQASQLGYLPRLRVVHTSESAYGQVYVPVINFLLLLAVLALVLTFRSSAKLAFAYGTAVTGTVLCTTILFFFIATHRWHLPALLVSAGAAFFLTIELTFFGANLTKIAHGAWFPILIGLALFTVMTTWSRGLELVTMQRKRFAGSLPELIDQVRSDERPVARTSGTGVFMGRNKDHAPLAMRLSVEHLQVLPDQAIIMWLQDTPTPRVREADRLHIDELGYKDDGILFVHAKFGYAEEHDVPVLLERLAEIGVERPLDPESCTFFISKVELTATNRPGMSRWRKQLFLATAVLAASPEDVFRLPRMRTITVGAEIEF
jgi:KUP system potassium uptake protein